MEVSQLPDVNGIFVAAENPSRTDLSGMDYERCAALHNYLVQYAWIAEGRPLAALHDSNTTFFTAHGAAAEVLRPQMHPSLAAFLDAAMLPPTDTPEPPSFFFWASELSDPDVFFADEVSDLHDEPEYSLACLYLPNIGQGGSSGGGLFYDQRRHCAAVFMHMDDYGYAMPIDAHRELWHPLETVLSNWIELIHLGKVTASPKDVPSRFGSEKIGPWEWQPYGEAQVTSCISAWDRLCEAVEARISPASTATQQEPLLTTAALDAASVPDDCFARAFLSRARRPGFRYIAPGLALPPIDAREFAARQPFTRQLRNPHIIPPICLLFTANYEPEVELSRASPFTVFRSGSDGSTLPSWIPAGLYTESVDRTAYDNAEEGFHLFLPYTLRGKTGDVDVGARQSDGSFVRGEQVDELFQHGYKPFGGDYYRPQRLERLLEHWTRMVHEGVWPVGLEGVEGNIDMFTEADGVRWREYVIPPSW